MTEQGTHSIRRLWYLVAIFAMSVALRMFGVAYYHEAPYSDSADYQRLAENVVRGHGYGYGPGQLSAFRACGYPLFLAAIYRVAGVDWLTAEYVQAVVGGASVLLVTALASLVVGRREGMLAGTLAAVYPGFVWLPRRLLSENVSVLLQLSALCAAVFVLRRRQVTGALALGVLLGLNLLTHGSSAFLAALIVVGIAATADARPSSRKSLTLAALIVSATGATLAPWIVRNYAVFHSFVPIANVDGITFYSSYWPVREGGKTIWGNVRGVDDPVVAAAYAQGNEAAMSRHLRRVTLRRLAERPFHAFRLIPVKILNLLVPLDWEIFPHRRGRSRSVNYGYLCAIPPALLGAWTLRQRRTPHQWVLFASPVSVVLLATIFYGSPRFRLPAEPALLIFAAIGLIALWDQVGRRRLEPASTGDAVS